MALPMNDERRVGTPTPIQAHTRGMTRDASWHLSGPQFSPL